MAGIIPASVSLQERRTRTLKHGDSFAVFDHNGDALSGPGRPEGIFHRDTRHLSQLYLTLGGKRPLLLSSTMRDDNATLTCDLTNPDFGEPGKIELEHDLIHIRRTRFLWQASCFERLAVRNFDELPHRVTLQLWFASDFADIFEVRGSRRPQRGTLHPPVLDEDRVELAYTGLDDQRRETLLLFHPRPNHLTPNCATFDLEMAPGEVVAVFIEVHCGGQTNVAAGPASFFRSMRDARRALRTLSSRAAGISSSNEVFNETARRSIADLYMLITETPNGPYPYAGIPWFSTVFGRDALITALETLWLDPSIAKGVLLHLAANQADRVDPSADAEPGKILHEMRSGEMAELGEVPFRRYFGSVDSTPLFVMLAGAYLERTGDLSSIRTLWPNIEAALGWIDNYGDCDGDGFIEYTARPAGLANQGWKDSSDSVFHADGVLARGPIALVEVQAYVYAAWRSAGRMAAELGDTDRANELNRRADALRRQFDEKFFDEELGTYVLALDGEKRPCRIRTSNAGHALFAGIAYPERASAVVATLMSPTSFSGWGVRTLASTEARYNPMSYHNGSVWPHDNAMIASGFARYGFRRQAARIFEGLFAAAVHIDLRRLPELFCGFPRKGGQSPTSYPVACSPQAWAAAAPLSLVRSCLGITFDTEALQITFDHPVLPDFLNEVVLQHLAVGGGRMDVAVRRANIDVAVHILARRGQVRVLTKN
ncbi:MAG: amylo-alpha,6-glucosidase [Hyphomicrobiales bacterium]|nr:amylo-alpha,6-glucosidase [Hyphomicrobiales bacterium]